MQFVIFLNLIMAVSIVRRDAQLDEASKVQDVAQEVETDHHVQGSMIESSEDGIIHHVHHVAPVNQVVLAQHVQHVQHVDRIPGGGIFPGGSHTPSGYEAPPAFQAPLEYNAPTGIMLAEEAAPSKSTLDKIVAQLCAMDAKCAAIVAQETAPTVGVRTPPSAEYIRPWSKFQARLRKPPAPSKSTLDKSAQQLSGETNAAIMAQEAAPSKSTSSLTDDPAMIAAMIMPAIMPPR